MPDDTHLNLKPAAPSLASAMERRWDLDWLRVIALFVMPTSFSILVKFNLIVWGTFAGLFLIYEGFIRRNAWIWSYVGLKLPC